MLHPWALFHESTIHKVQCTEKSLYSGHHWEPTLCPLQRDVPNSGGLGVFPAGEVLRNQAIEHNVAAFSELSFALRWQGMLSRGYNMYYK